MSKPKPLIFLDFDGVLHPTSVNPDRWFSCAELLGEALQGAQCEIVISSSWRFSHSLAQLKNLLPIDLAERVTATTGAAHVGKFARYTEIGNFIGSRRNLRWVALDDCAWDFPKACPLIVCNPNTGMTLAEAERVRLWMNEPVFT